jgi:entericidin B
VRKHISLVVALLVLIGIAPLLSACNTAAGLGEDLSSAGHAITKTAEKHAP